MGHFLSVFLAVVVGCQHSPTTIVEVTPEGSPAEHAAAESQDEHWRVVTPRNPDIEPHRRGLSARIPESTRVPLAGGWVITLPAKEFVAFPGEELSFSFELRATRPGSGRPTLHSANPRVRLLEGSGDLDIEGRLPEQGGIVNAVLLAAPDTWAARKMGLEVVLKGRTSPEAVAYLELPTPSVKLNMSGVKPVRMERLKDGCELLPGLSVLVGADEAMINYSSRAYPLPTETEFAGAYLLENEDGRLTFIGFVRQSISDYTVVVPGQRDPLCRGKRRVWVAAVGASLPIDSRPMDIWIFSALDDRSDRHVTSVVAVPE